MEDQAKNTRITTGIILIIIGSLFFLDTLDIIAINVGRIIFSWQFIILFIGIIILINSRNKFLGILLTIVGLIFITPRIFPFIYINGSIIFPLIIIGLGIYIIFKQRRSVNINYRLSSKGEKLDNDVIDDIAIFGGGTKVLTSENFKGGNITAIFGGSEIDLSNCKLAEGNNVIDILTLFGGTELYIPRNWNVIVNVTPIFGGFSNKTYKDPNQQLDTTRTLTIKGLAIFGGGEIKTKF